MKNRYRVVLGDWSNDGHEKSEDVLFDTNKTSDEIRKAYLKSTEKTGITFDTNHHKQGDTKITHKLCCKYEDCLIPIEVIDIFIEHGMKVYFIEDMKEGESQYSTPDDSIFTNRVRRVAGTETWQYSNRLKEPSGVYVGKDDFFDLIMWFISLSLEDFKYEVIEEEKVECINGWWHKDLNQMWGYGLFYS